MASFLVGTNAFVIAGLLPEIANSLDSTTVEVTLAITAYAVVVAVASPVFAVFFAAVPPTILMTSGLVTFGIGTATAAISDEL